MSALTRQEIEEALKSPHSFIKQIMNSAISALYNKEYLDEIITQKTWLDLLRDKLHAKKIDSSTFIDFSEEEDSNADITTTPTNSDTPIGQTKAAAADLLHEALMAGLQAQKLAQINQHNALVQTAMQTNPALAKFLINTPLQAQINTIFQPATMARMQPNALEIAFLFSILSTNIPNYGSLKPSDVKQATKLNLFSTYASAQVSINQFQSDINILKPRPTPNSKKKNSKDDDHDEKNYKTPKPFNTHYTKG